MGFCCAGVVVWGVLERGVAVSGASVEQGLEAARLRWTLHLSQCEWCRLSVESDSAHHLCSGGVGLRRFIDQAERFVARKPS